MKRAIIVVVLVGVGLFAWIMLRQQDPVTTAKVKCEAALERFTSYDISVMDVSRASVVGDVFTGTVTMPFEVGGQRRVGVCVFDSGTTKRVSLDGKLLAGTR